MPRTINVYSIDITERTRTVLSFVLCNRYNSYFSIYRGADKSLARPGRKQDWREFLSASCLAGKTLINRLN